MTEYDAFVDYCEDNGLDHEAEDFYAWQEDQRARSEAHQEDLDYMAYEGN